MFNRIYIEEECIDNLNTIYILNKIRCKNIIKIKNYKEIFNRKNQNYLMQKENPNLIIANKKTNFLYKLSEYCEDYGKKEIYYASTMLNCMFKCEYCYLSGMYNTGNIVIFVNLDKLEEEIKNLSKNSYVCISYDSDLLALNEFHNYYNFFYQIAKKYDVTLELRTKSTVDIKLNPLDNFIISYTLTPDEIIKDYERNTPKLEYRLNQINKLLNKGFKVQIALEPLLFIENYNNIYNNMLNKISLKIDLTKIDKFSIGTFRVNHNYYKNMLKNNPHSKILNFPFIIKDNMVLYDIKKEENLINLVYQFLLSKSVNKEKIHIWN